ncbi:hypothetical protein [Virgibacillus sediminis]|uniref:Tetratricopeptide repeat protein n=1 Tax=Virgibacillus sediminis TaxID=202260 RepID=A0ABV7AA15_9BACI
MTAHSMEVQINKKKFPLTAKRITVYKQSKVIEAVDQSGRYYYLLFYKDQFLNGTSTDHMKLGTHIHRAWKHGIHFDGTHPLAGELLRQRDSYSFTSFHLFFKRLKETYSHTQTALIATFFDTFASSGEINRILKEIYYHYQRNGQVFKAYQILLLGTECEPSVQFFTDMINKLEFKPYKEMYQHLDKAAEKAPIQLESICFSNLLDPSKATKLLSFYQQQGRWMDELTLRIHLLGNRFTSDNFSAIQGLAKNFTEQEQLDILLDLYNSCRHPQVAEHLAESLFALGDADSIVEYVMASDLPLQERHLPNVLEAFEQADDLLLASLMNRPIDRLLEISKHEPHLLEQLAAPFVRAALKEYSPDDILDWLAPLSQAGHHLPIEQKLHRMKSLAEDPDRQYDLGELYFHFRQLDQAIDCFTWEMELHPENPKPVNYLVKICTEKGEKEEAAAYKQLLIHMQKR